MSLDINKKSNSINKFFNNSSANFAKIISTQDIQPQYTSKPDIQTQEIVYLHDKSPYICNNAPYFFLNDQLLSQQFGEFMETDTEYNIQILIYQINTDCELPFIQYLFDITNEKASLPNIRFQCPVGVAQGLGKDPNQGLGQGQEHTFFMNQCSQELLKVLPIYDIFNSELLEKIYKGFIEKEKTLYVIFDSTNIENKIEINEKYNWLIVDEIINKKKINGKEINQDIVDMLNNTPYMTNILDISGNRIIHPNLLYLCNNNNTNTEYKNVVKSSNTESIELFDDTIEHSWLGASYYFSSVPIEKSTNLIKRYSAFTYNAKYILKDIDQISQEEKDAVDTDLAENDISSIYFKENGIQLWCIYNNNQFTEI
jgi:hypothetical protein